MAQVKLFFVAAALALAVILPEASAGVIRLSNEIDPAVANSSPEADNVSVPNSEDSSSSDEEADHSRQVRQEPSLQGEMKDEIKSLQDEVLPPNPASDEAEQTKVDPGQTFESRYKHGVVPAKLPAQESDNAHQYRHSIIHPYGDDIHA